MLEWLLICSKNIYYYLLSRKLFDLVSISRIATCYVINVTSHSSNFGKTKHFANSRKSFNLLIVYCRLSRIFKPANLSPVRLTFYIKIIKLFVCLIICIWHKVFKRGPSKICGRQPLKILRRYGLLKHTISLQIFKGCLPQIVIGPLLIILSQMFVQVWVFNF